jgi:hypothetical protein
LGGRWSSQDSVDTDLMNLARASSVLTLRSDCRGASAFPCPKRGETMHVTLGEVPTRDQHFSEIRAINLSWCVPQLVAERRRRIIEKGTFQKKYAPCPYGRSI